MKTKKETIKVIINQIRVFLFSIQRRVVLHVI